MTKAIRIHETGGPEVLRWEEVDVGPPGPGQARVRQTAVGLNFIDTYHRSGVYPLPSLPSGLGVEGAGVVEAVGDGVSEVRPGQRVGYALGELGAYAEERVVSVARLVPLPDFIDDETAAAVLLKGMTVEYLVRRTFPVQSGQTVLLHAAAGGVGLLASQWLRALGATVIGTVGSDEKAELARAHGCHHTVIYTREQVVERVRELTHGEGVPVVYDSVGKATFAASLDCLRRRGTLVSFGNASGKPEPFDLGILARKGSLYVTRPSLGDYVANRFDLIESANAVFDGLRRRVLRVEIRQRWPLADARAAHEALEARQTTGSSVLVPG